MGGNQVLPKCVLLIGIDPALLDLSSYRGLIAEQIVEAAKAANEKLVTLGYEIQTCFVDLVHQVRGWYSGVAIKMGRRQGATKEHI
jgi:hypothetical protein